MTKQFMLLQLFSILDGRLSTTMNDIYDILNHICDSNLMTHHLPIAMDYLKSKNPWWFCNEKTKLETQIDTLCPIKERNFEQFKWIMSNMELDKTIVDVPQLKDEFDTSDFGEFMYNNSLLLNR